MGTPIWPLLALLANTVSVLIGNGDGTFQPRVDLPTGGFPWGLVVGDFNADGNLDLAVTNTGCENPASVCLGTVSILLGNGDGTFQTRADYMVGLYPVMLAQADLNGDGGQDLAVPNAQSGSVSILLNLPVIGIFPSSVGFGAQKVDVQSSPRTITLGNPSGTPLSISKPKIVGTNAGDFSESTTCPLAPATLAPGADCSFSVTFTPKATGNRSASLTLKDSVPGSPQSIALGGTGQ